MTWKTINLQYKNTCWTFFKNLSGKAREKLLIWITKDLFEKKWLNDCLNFTLRAISKKVSPVKCLCYRKIISVSHTSEMIFKVLRWEVLKIAKRFIGKDKSDFRDRYGTRGVIGIIRLVSEKMIGNNIEPFACIVYFEKVFDRLQWRNQLEIEKMYKHLRGHMLVRNLYSNQAVRVVTDTSYWWCIRIWRGWKIRKRGVFSIFGNVLKSLIICYLIFKKMINE